MDTNSPAYLASLARMTWRATYSKRSKTRNMFASVDVSPKRFGWSDGGGSYSVAFSDDMTRGAAVSCGEVYMVTLEPITIASPEILAEIEYGRVSDHACQAYAPDLEGFENVDAQVWIVDNSAYLARY